MATANTLPPAIEIFRAGTQVDDAGNAHHFSEADLADIARGYNPALREAPLTVGHPADNLPAYGWVKGLAANANLLLMDPHQVEPQFAEMVQTGRFKKRSASFYPPNSPSNPTPGKWYLRHVAFLGAQPPAVAGLKDIQFAAGDCDAVNFSQAVPPLETTMTPEEKAALDKAQADAQAAKDALAAVQAEADTAKAQLANFAEQQRKDRHGTNVSFCEAQVKAGKLLPKDQATAVAVLDQLGDAKPVEFSEGGTDKKVSAADFVKTLIAGGAPQVSFGEFAPGGAGPQPGQKAGDMSDAEIDKLAKNYAAKNNVSYSEALGRVVSFTA